jgi:hypothetical protein
MKRIAITIKITLALLFSFTLTSIAQPDWWVEDYHPADSSEYEDNRGGTRTTVWCTPREGCYVH